MIEGLIGDVIGNAAYDFIKAGARHVLGARLGKDIDEAQREQALAAYREAMEEWLIELIETFRYLEYDDEQIRAFFRPYQEALPKFLIDEEVADELLRPFTDDIEQPRLDHSKLVERWQANGFKPLPLEFPAPAACRKYLRRLNQKRIVTPELRELLRANGAHPH